MNEKTLYRLPEVLIQNVKLYFGLKEGQLIQNDVSIENERSVKIYDRTENVILAD